jgi:uncharacterized protein (UPF0333 family)
MIVLNDHGDVSLFDFVLLLLLLVVVVVVGSVIYFLVSVSLILTLTGSDIEIC